MTPFLLGHAGGVSVAFGLLGPVIIPDAVFAPRPAVCAHMVIAARDQWMMVAPVEAGLALPAMRRHDMIAVGTTSSHALNSSPAAGTVVLSPLFHELALALDAPMALETMSPETRQLCVDGGRGVAMSQLHGAQHEFHMPDPENVLVVDTSEPC